AIASAAASPAATVTVRYLPGARVCSIMGCLPPDAEVHSTVSIGALHLESVFSIVHKSHGASPGAAAGGRGTPDGDRSISTHWPPVSGRVLPQALPRTGLE